MSDIITKSPQIRFAGLTDSWEQVKLKDCFTERSERSAEGELISVTITSGVVKASDLDRKDNSSSDKSNYKVVKVGDIAYNSMRMWQGASGFSPYDGILSPAYTVITPKENSNSKFFAYNFKRHEMIWTFQINSQGLTSDTWNLKFPALSSIKIAVPSYEEQNKIALFFEKLDHQLALHQRELELLKDTKKSLLQKMFPKDGTNVPEIRFEGFTDAWQQRKLGELAEFSKGNGYTKNDLRETGFPVVLYGRLYTKYETIINNVDTFVEMKDKSVISEGNEVVVPASGESAEDISRASVVGKPGFILGGDLNIIKPKQEVNSIFLALTISNGTQQKEMSKRAQGKSVVHLRNSDLKEINLLYPKLEEQKQIGTFFNNLDNLITLHQLELNSLKNLKKSLLQQMFV
ncbi:MULTISPECIES: restriction endonuclease subunit S [Bacillus cereus group]|uniref:restriction endonuclease subunit S n=1 Tax=Bacillus cereus group TaxID=86661 RepID=UPI0009B3C0E3